MDAQAVLLVSLLKTAVVNFNLVKTTFRFKSAAFSNPIHLTLKHKIPPLLVGRPIITQQKMNNLLQAAENSTEQCSAAHIVPGCQQY